MRSCLTDVRPKSYKMPVMDLQNFRDRQSLLAMTQDVRQACSAVLVYARFRLGLRLIRLSFRIWSTQVRTTAMRVAGE